MRYCYVVLHKPFPKFCLYLTIVRYDKSKLRGSSWGVNRVGETYMDTVSIREIDDTILVEARFTPLADDGILWEKDSVCYGREAALQRALRKLDEEESVHLFGQENMPKK
jgi:hypothetical protein